MANEEISQIRLAGMDDGINDLPISNRTKNCLIKNNCNTCSDLMNLTLGQLKLTKGLGASGITEIRDILFGRYKFTFKAEKKEKKKKIANFEGARKIVSHLLDKEKVAINWAMQLPIADKLIQIYSVEDLLSVKPLDGVYSLKYYLAWKGKEHLDKNIIKKVSKVEKVEAYQDEQVNLPEEETEEYQPAERKEKPKSFRDFLKL